MSEHTGIAWTEKTWNPWMGCTKVSPGCAHCYAEREHLKYKLPDFSVVRRAKTTFTAPLKWKEPARVFTCSWSDWFHEGADAWRDEAWEIIRRTPHLTYQILTKRPERILAHLPWGAYGDPWPNVWLGVSVEDQRRADDRIPALLNTPAAVRFLSCEPLIGHVALAGAWHDYLAGWCTESEHGPHCSPESGCASDCPQPVQVQTPHVDWVIVGGESGLGARPMNLDWARSLRDQCARAAIPFFLKQLGGHPDAQAHEKALLDGVTHTEMPR